MKNQPRDDGQSNATVTTEDSSVSGRGLVATRRSDSTLNETRNIQTRSRSNQQTWRSGFRSVPSFSAATSISRSSDTLEHSARPTLYRRDSDPGAPNEKRSAPMKCPPRQRNVMAGHTPGTTYSSSPIGEDSNYLMKMYDTRTWELYRRITEARKNSSYASTTNTTSPQLDHNNTGGEGTSGWENLQHDNSDCESEMVFLFDFD
jgi:hypothetical protein